MASLCHSLNIWLKVLIVNTPPTLLQCFSSQMYEAFSMAHLPSSASAKVIKWHRQKMVTDSRDRERKSITFCWQILLFDMTFCKVLPQPSHHSSSHRFPNQLSVSSDMTKLVGVGGVVAGQILFFPSIECQVVYWLLVFWLASLWANLTAGRWIVLNDESVCFQKVFSFLLNLKDGRAGGKNPLQNEGDVQEESEMPERSQAATVLTVLKILKLQSCDFPLRIIFVFSLHPLSLSHLPPPFILSFCLCFHLFPTWSPLPLLDYYSPFPSSPSFFLPSCVSYHPNFFFILNLIFLLSFSHLQWLIFPSLSLLLIMFVLFLTCCLHLCHLTFSLFKVATNYMRNGEN